MLGGMAWGAGAALGAGAAAAVAGAAAAVGARAAVAALAAGFLAGAVFAGAFFAGAGLADAFLTGVRRAGALVAAAPEPVGELSSEAAYASRSSAGSRPRSATVMPCLRAHARTSDVSGVVTGKIVAASVTHAETAVDGQHGARDIGACVAREKRYDGGDLLRRGGPSEGDGLEQLLAS